MLNFEGQNKLRPRKVHKTLSRVSAKRVEVAIDERLGMRRWQRIVMSALIRWQIWSRTLIGWGNLFETAGTTTRCTPRCGYDTQERARSVLVAYEGREFIGVDGEGGNRPNRGTLNVLISVGSESLTVRVALRDLTYRARVHPR